MSFSVEVSRPGAGVAVVSFSDPVRANQLCWAAVDALAERLRQCRESGARVVVLASALAGHWLEHAWLGDLLAGIDGQPQTGSGAGWFECQRELAHAGVVSIAAINGDCSGGGAELGWACDLRIAERQARFAQPEVALGLTTGIGGCSRLLRLAGRGVATEMVLTGRPLAAERLYALGAVNAVVDTGEALPQALALARRIASYPSQALSGLKSALDAADRLPLEEALVQEQAIFQGVLAGADAQRGMRAAQRAYEGGASVAAVAGWQSLPER